MSNPRLPFLCVSVAVLSVAAFGAWHAASTWRARPLLFDHDDASKASILARERKDGILPVEVGVLRLSSQPGDNADLFEVLEKGGLCSCRYVDSRFVQMGRLSELNVLFVPGGSGKRFAEDLQDAGRANIRSFVRGGGGYVGLCAGAYLAADQDPAGEKSLNLIDLHASTANVALPGGNSVSMADRGIGEVTIEFTDAGLAIAGPISRNGMVSYTGGPVFSSVQGTSKDDAVVIARFRGEIVAHEAQRGMMIDSPAIVGARYGAGRVVVISPHLEQSDVYSRALQQLVLCVAPQ